MTAPEIEKCKSTITILIDSREHENSSNFQSRVRALTELTGRDPIRKKLDAGDYSCQFTDPDGNEVSMESVFICERKMSAEELSGNLAQEKERFEREFTRAKQAGVKRIYLLVEGTTLGNILHGFYNTKLSSNAYKASLFALMVRYTIIPIFINKNDTAEVIYNICKWEVDDYLEHKDAERFDNADQKCRNRKSKNGQPD